MKLLYISSWHTTQEFDDLTLLTELGYDWFSTGYYVEPKEPLSYRGIQFRKALNKEIDLDLYYQFKKINTSLNYYNPPNLSRDFISKFDIIFCNYSSPYPEVIKNLIPCINKNTPILYRTYGHQTPQLENNLKEFKRTHNLYLIRNSPSEKCIENYAGEDLIFRGYVDENIYNQWTGFLPNILTFANDFNVRLPHENYECYRQYLSYIYNEFPCLLCGSGNERVTKKTGVTWEEQLAFFKSFRLYFSLNSPPANFPYSFIEALMTGIPVVSIGPKLGNVPGKNNFEVPNIITNETNGFYSDNIVELKHYMSSLLKDYNLSQEVGKKGRETALKFFSKKMALSTLDTFLKGIK